MIPGLGTYVDDTYGADKEGDLDFYSGYEDMVMMPAKQVALLELWDDLGIPHKLKKQVSGSPLTVIGIEVDPNELTFSLPETSRIRLVQELRFWGARPAPGKGVSFKLREWQSLTGWVNWALNVYPLIRPCLSWVYEKMRRDDPDAPPLKPTSNIWVNDKVRRDLNWAADIVENSTGTRLICARNWDPSEADLTIYCDASGTGLAYWYPSFRIGYHAPIPAGVMSGNIFYNECLALVSALHDSHTILDDGAKILIYTNSMNTVDIFSSMSGLPSWNWMLKSAVDVILLGDYDLRVLHVSTTTNAVANTLSRQDFNHAIRLVPDIIIREFQPLTAPDGEVDVPATNETDATMT